MRRLLLGILTAFALCVLPSVAHGAVFLAADATGDPGYIRLTAVGSTDLHNLRFGELRDNRFELLGTGEAFTPFEQDGRFGEIGAYTDDRAAQWRCDRRTRTFRIYATDPDGNDESADFTVRTPSCAHRFTFDGPLEIKPGRYVKIFVRDTFELGDTDVDVCRRSPTATAPTCRKISFGAGASVVRQFFTVATKGRWMVTVKTPQQKIERVLNVGVKPLPGDLARLPSLVTTGDSLMQGPDALLEDRLDDQAVVHSDVHVGSGLTRPFIVDWSKLPGQQLREYHPAAVMLFLGANDNTAIDGVGCCGDAWIAKYAALASKTMTTYTKGGAQVFWLNIPIPEDAPRQPNAIAVNQALLKAAANNPDVHIIDIASVFTPGNVYRETMEYDGQVVHPRQSDGLHLSVAGSSITDRIIVQALKKYGVL